LFLIYNKGGLSLPWCSTVDSKYDFIWCSLFSSCLCLLISLCIFINFTILKNHWWYSLQILPWSITSFFPLWDFQMYIYSDVFGVFHIFVFLSCFSLVFHFSYFSEEVLGFELGASCLLGRCSTVWAFFLCCIFNIVSWPCFKFTAVVFYCVQSDVNSFMLRKGQARLQYPVFPASLPFLVWPCSFCHQEMKSDSPLFLLGCHVLWLIECRGRNGVAVFSLGLWMTSTFLLYFLSACFASTKLWVHIPVPPKRKRPRPSLGKTQS
jgi:hypothetical protein